MAYRVRLLRPASVFLEGLPRKLRAKAFRTVELLREFGPLMGPPHAKAVTGQRGLRELRVRYASDICRLFYFHYRDVVYVVTSGYVKKARKLDEREIDRATRLMREVLEGIHGQEEDSDGGLR
jgi:phage-related protein